MLEFPAEIWVMIVEDLPPSSQRSCLSLSHLLHDIAIRSLFSWIKLDLRRNEGSCTRDILDRIVRDREVARLVKNLVVIVDRVIEGWKLAKAIESMPQLVSFQWIGEAMYFPEEVAEAIASCCPRLHELALPADGTVYHAPLLNLHNLRALRTSWIQFHSFAEWAQADASNTDITDNFDLDGHLKMIDANQDTLRELHFVGLHLDRVPVRVFDSLAHLELYIYAGEISGLPFVFHEAVRLESLALTGWNWKPFLPLDTDTEILPSLSSFHISTFSFCSSKIWRSISNFIRRRVSLRRLSLHVPSYWSICSEILPILKDLPELRVLGLYTGDDKVDLEFLVLHLPPTLEALYLALFWRENDSPAPPRGVLGSLPNLAFLHIFDMADGLPITAQELAHDMKRLHVVGRQESLWDIVRVGNNETLLPLDLSGEWRVEGDFPDEDSGWLLKYL